MQDLVHKSTAEPPVVLATKLYMPNLRGPLISRPHLIERLNAGLQDRSGMFSRKLTLISAPAGFGKTTLIVDWLAQMAIAQVGATSEQSPVPSEPPKPRKSSPSPHERQTRIAWVSLDQRDNDVMRFLTYLIAALDRHLAGISDQMLPAMGSSQQPPSEALLTHLINGIVSASTAIVFVLDDFHAITAAPVHDALTFLLESQPAHVHLVLSSRVDPPWPFARLRAQGDMIELRANDLRFSLDETTAYFNNLLGLDLVGKDIIALDRQIEGWIAGLQMAALAMQGSLTGGLAEASEFVRAFTGSHRFVLDFLLEEVLYQQPSDIQEYLLQTSILERMTDSLCHAVTGRDGDRSNLARLDQANLFVIPLDDHRQWYRYHHLFADLLRARLQQLHPELVSILHERASDWYERAGFIPEAIDHALAAGNVERVAVLFEKSTLSVVGRLELRSLLANLDSLPQDMVAGFPRLRLARAWALLYLGELELAELEVQVVMEALSGLEDPFAIRELSGRIAVIQSTISETRGDVPEAIRLAERALRQLPPEDLSMRAYAMSCLGVYLREMGDWDAAFSTFSEAISISRATDSSHVTAMTLCRLATLQIGQGKLRAASDTCQEAIQSAKEQAEGGQSLPTLGYAYSQQSAILYEWNELDEALRLAKEGVRISGQWGQADILGLTYRRLARIQQAVGDTEGALEAIQTAKTIAHQLSPWFGETTDAFEVEILLQRLGRDPSSLARATWWAQKFLAKHPGEFDFSSQYPFRVLARVRLAQGRPDAALELLSQLLEMDEKTEANLAAVESLNLMALALQAKGQKNEALAKLERALLLSEAEGYKRVFVNEGEPMGALLRRAASQGIAGPTVDNLLTALAQEAKDGSRVVTDTPTTMVQRSATALTDPLTKREMDVLQLLPTDLTASEIADDLFVAPSTVRSHIKSIYSKLDVHNRGQAVQKAQDFGLI